MDGPVLQWTARLFRNKAPAMRWSAKIGTVPPTDQRGSGWPEGRLQFRRIGRKPEAFYLMGQLDADGGGTALFDARVPRPPIIVGLTLYFAYGLNAPWDFVSNPVGIRVAP